MKIDEQRSTIGVLDVQKSDNNRVQVVVIKYELRYLSRHGGIVTLCLFTVRRSRWCLSESGLAKMSNANIKTRVCSTNLSKVRQRKVENKFPTGEMVKLGSDESLGSSIADTIIESEMKSDEETESDEEHARRLIPSPVICQSSINAANKSITRNDQYKQIQDENVWSISIQLFIPFLLAGFGMVAASLLLDLVQVRANITFDGNNTEY